MRAAFLAQVSALGLIATLGSCGGGGGGGGSNTAQGRFVDSPVEGLEYSTPSKSGLTGDTGLFDYVPGETVTFKIGGIMLGSAPGASVVNPLSLAGVTSPTTGKDLNIARLLQTLDQDADPANGITISASTRQAAVGQTMSLEGETTAWEANPEVLSVLGVLTSNSLVSAQAAQGHIDAWLSAAYTGEYAGSFSTNAGAPVPLSGTWRLVVNNAGFGILCMQAATGESVSAPVDISPDGEYSYAFGADSVDLVIQNGLVAFEWSFDDDDDNVGAFQGTATGQLTVRGLYYPDGEGLDVWDSIFDTTILGGIYDTQDTFVYNFELELVSLLYGTYYLDGVVAPFTPDERFATLCITSITTTSASFIGISDEGERFTGTLTPAGAVSGTWTEFNGTPGGTFEAGD